MFSVAVLVSALVFAAVGGSQLRRSATALTGEAGKTLVAALLVWIGLPILAILVGITVVGLPLAIAIVFLGLPTLWLLGHITAGTRLAAGYSASATAIAP